MTLLFVPDTWRDLRGDFIPKSKFCLLGDCDVFGITGASREALQPWAGEGGRAGVEEGDLQLMPPFDRH